MTNFTIQITSDTVCPWCYVGFRRLSRAIATHKESHPSDTFTINWSPFFLDAHAPPYPGIDKHERYQIKFGAERAAAIFSRLTAVGAGEGIKFSFNGRMGNSRDSHRLIWYAGEKEKEQRLGAGKAGEIGGLQTRVVEKLFRAYFEDEKNITERAMLIEAAVAGGLEREEAEKVLDSDLGWTEVDTAVERAHRRFVTGVPYYLVQGQYAIEGADVPETFLEAFAKVKQSGI